MELFSASKRILEKTFLHMLCGQKWYLLQEKLLFQIWSRSLRAIQNIVSPENPWDNLKRHSEAAIPGGKICLLVAFVKLCYESGKQLGEYFAG